MSSCWQIATLCFGHAEHYIIINGCKLLKIFEHMLMFNLNEPSHVSHLADSQWRNRDINNYFYECKKNIVLLIKRETF